MIYNRTKLSPPWITFVNMVHQMFDDDPDITSIVYDSTNRKLKIYCEDQEKANALAAVFVDDYGYGDSAINITVIPANGKVTPLKGNMADLLPIALSNNPHLSFTRTIEGAFGFKACYVVFKHEIAQFFNDNLHDIYGNATMLFAEIAEEIFKSPMGVFYCTDVKKSDEPAMRSRIWP